MKIRTSLEAAAGAVGAAVPDGHTRRAIVRLLLESGSITAVEIGDRLGLTPASISASRWRRTPNRWPPRHGSRWAVGGPPSASG